MEQKSDLKMIELKPVRPAVGTPHTDLQIASHLADAYDTGRWDSIIDICEGRLAGFVESFPNPIFDGGDVTKLYFSSQAYKAKGENDKYIACLKILYSLTPFGHAVGGKYRDLLEFGAKEYINLKDNFGADYLNEFKVSGLFKKSGCFIASAAYDSPLSEQVMFFREFRNSILLNNRFGKIFVKLYYLFSPFLANIIAKSDSMKTVTRFFLNQLIIIIKKFRS